MKKVLFNTALLLAGTLTLTLATAQENRDTDRQRAEPKFKKTKSYSKSYPLSGSDRVSLSNQFGEMKLNTWDKNEIKVDISITGKSDEEPRAQEILDKISIEDSKSGNTVSFKTNFADDKRNKNANTNKNDNQNRKEHQNEGMEINYTVYLPSGNALKADNQFGKMIVPDYKGEADLSSKFGSLTAGRLSNSKEVSVEFGKAEIAQVSGGDLNIKFSSGNVNKVSGNVNSDIQFSQVKMNLDNESKNLVMNNSYSTVYLDVDRNFSANFDISTSHGDFKNETAFPIKSQNEEKSGYGPRFNNKYTGQSGGGSSKVKVSSSFGEVIIGHDMKVDVTEKKSKNKNKSSKVI